MEGVKPALFGDCGACRIRASGGIVRLPIAIGMMTVKAGERIPDNKVEMTPRRSSPDAWWMNTATRGQCHRGIEPVPPVIRSSRHSAHRSPYRRPRGIPSHRAPQILSESLAANARGPPNSTDGTSAAPFAATYYRAPPPRAARPSRPPPAGPRRHRDPPDSLHGGHRDAASPWAHRARRSPDAHPILVALRRNRRPTL